MVNKDVVHNTSIWHECVIHVLLPQSASTITVALFHENVCATVSKSLYLDQYLQNASVLHI